jgi:uncharacterized protein (DUF1778 family)
MKKDERLQVRVTSEQAAFLKSYAANKSLTISQMMRDFINWLKKREQERGGNGSE